MNEEKDQKIGKDDKSKSNGKFRQLTGIVLRISQVVAVCFVAFHIYTAGAGPFPNLRQRAIHTGFALILTFMLLPFRKKDAVSKKIPFFDIIFIGFAIWGVIHIVVDYNWIMEHPAESRPIDFFLGIVMTLLILEAGRRAVGILFPILTAFFLFYTYFGMIFPDPWKHPTYPLDGIIQVLYLSDMGMWGFVTGISANIVAIFIIFGSFLLFTGGGETFIDFSLWLTGKYYGGAAKVSTVASGLFGMISGSAVANTATTGNFTIPMMKRLKYGSNFAAAVEATASSAGQLTPPIMGAGAFLMAEILEIPYLKVALAAALPAFLFYIGIFSSIHLESEKKDLGKVPEDRIPSAKQTLRPSRSLPLVIPLVVLFIYLFRGYSPTAAAFWACSAALVLFIFSNPKPNEIISRLKIALKGAEAAGKSLVQVVALLVCANMIIALINLTGVGIKMSDVIMSVSGNSEFIALILAAVVSLILGMGIPTTGAYLLSAAVVVPALTKLGAPPIAAHLFVFYYAVLSALTPPVCAGVYVAAGIANASWIKTAWIAIRLALVKYIIPFIFIYNPELVFVGPIHSILLAFLTATIGVFFIGAGTMGYFKGTINIVKRLIFLGGAFLLLLPGISTDAFGLILLLGMAGYQIAQRKKLDPQRA